MQRGAGLGTPWRLCLLGQAMPAWLPPSPCVSLFARALSPALGAVTLPPAPGAPVAARPFSKHNTRERPALKSNRLFTPFTAAARVGLFLPGKRGGKKRGLNPTMSWDSGMWVRKLTKQRPGCQRRPPSQGGREPQEEDEGRTDPPAPYHAAEAPPPSIPAAAALARAFEASFLPHPPAAGWFKSRFRQAVGSPVQGSRQPGSPGHGASPRSWLGLGGRGSFARFGRVSQRLSAGVPTAFPSRHAAVEPVQPVRPTVRGEKRGGHGQGRLGTHP